MQIKYKQFLKIDYTKLSSCNLRNCQVMIYFLINNHFKKTGDAV